MQAALDTWWCVAGVQVELVNLLDLQLLSDGDSPEKSDEDDGTEWRMRNSTKKSMEAHPLISLSPLCINLMYIPFSVSFPKENLERRKEEQ